jgi:hypothetical protein
LRVGAARETRPPRPGPACKLGPLSIEKIIHSDEAQRLRQAIDSAINNYASLFERQGRYTRIIGHNEYLEAREMKAYEIDTAIVAGVKTTL